jgi:hypothetical protein
MHHADGKNPASRIALARKNCVAMQAATAATANKARKVLNGTERTCSASAAPCLEWSILRPPSAARYREYRAENLQSD